MIIRHEATPIFPIPGCHGGEGDVLCREILGDYDRASPGLLLVHEDVLAPGVSIGEHRHEGDEEVYLILEGTGEMLVNGVPQRVGPGDACITREGDSHSLVNTGDVDLRLVVVAARTAPRSAAPEAADQPPQII